MKQLIAEDLLKIKAVFLRPNEPFTWASGIKSPIYCEAVLYIVAHLGVAQCETVVAIDRTLDTTSPCEWLVWTKEDGFDLEQVFSDCFFHYIQSFNVSKFHAAKPLVSMFQGLK